jgi:RNA polymerase sigma-70 factor (ECF subfamily)
VSMQDTELLNRLKNHDDAAFRFLIDRYQASILNCCFKFIKNKEIAQEATQDVFIEVYRSIDKFREESKLSTWLFRIAITKSLDYIKSMKRKKRFGLIKSILPGSATDEQFLISDALNPLQQLENEDRQKVLYWAIDTLPANQKVAFTLSKVEELSNMEIAEILHTSVSSVESLLFRAKANLRKKLFSYYNKHL